MKLDEMVKLIGPGGDARAHFRNRSGEWVDGFMDQLLYHLTKTRLEDITLQYGARSANVVTSGDGVQLNVRWSDNAGWSCYTAPTYDEAVAQMWQQRHMVNQLRENPHGLSTEQQQPPGT